MAFTRATKKKSRARIALIGPSGSGKTIDALIIARQLVGPEGRIAVRDSEHGSAALYSDRFVFDSDEPSNHSPESYISAIREAEKCGYDCLILDSWSHAWAGAGGILEQSDKKGKQFSAWKDLTPQQNAMVEAILGAKVHIIATMRTKTEWVIEKVKKGDREVNEPRKVGTAPVQRQDVDYEFTVVANIDIEHNVQIDKTRCSLLDGKFFDKEHVSEVGDVIREWLADGEDADQKKAKLSELFAGMKELGMKEAPAFISWINHKLNPPKGMEIRTSGDLTLQNITVLLEEVSAEKARTQPAQQSQVSGGDEAKRGAAA
jgi:DNA polymerase III delta prime subunit